MSNLSWFTSKLAKARIVDAESIEWIRLDRVINSEEEMFHQVALSMDYELGLDSTGNIYVSKDHALNIQGWRYGGTKKKLDIARNWIVFLAVLLALVFLARYMA